VILTVENLAYQLWLALKRHRNPGGLSEETLRRLWEEPRFNVREEKAECLAQAHRLLDIIRAKGEWRFVDGLAVVSVTPPPQPPSHPLPHVCDDDCPEHGWRAP